MGLRAKRGAPGEVEDVDVFRDGHLALCEHAQHRLKHKLGSMRVPRGSAGKRKNSRKGGTMRGRGPGGRALANST